ncbi:MAG: hypothetical protein REI12_01805 [Pedobacter sp.]|nr:hypothetical protein [Pedobacter sp.]
MVLDSLRAAGVKLLLNKYFEDIGVIDEVDINAKLDHASLLISPKGEMNRVRLEVSYRVDDDAFFVLEHFQCERVWIENLLNRYVAGLRIGIEHPTVQSLLKHVL